ncbi:hypothetical protein J4E93_000516 [Alternaria ventricosa]|uniref:uncharacterized protein n=1 Tax=Alternaria ventricosa TaxID=1187951 RepID=UPI0020C38AEF|nr:uncharacterized protein J4E93_000516 [Alternaria ventricosa]KAI4655801.1 hypothetical protein J4E93_000516 [Alternaria ventricosa]
MSSGNPFRLSQAPRQPAPVPQTSFINTDSSVLEARREDSDHVLEDAAPPSTGKTKKSVRILSPTTTIPPPIFDDSDATLNELMARRSSQGRPASPPPPVTPAGFVNNSVTAGEANAQVVGKDAMAIADASTNPRPTFGEPLAMQSPGNVPANPFSRTLASLEPQDKESEEERTNTGRPMLGNSRASLDVESFKNLLLTGKATPRPSGPPQQSTSASQPVAGAQFETSSSTDTSSVSRQSLFEPIQESHADSPRTSVDMADSEEDESMGLVSEVKKGKKKPPPAPKHRHGKLVTQRQPQTVSFESFAATEPTPPPAVRRTDSSDTNKPLPPTPIAPPQSSHISTQDTTSLQPQPTPPAQDQPSPPPEKSTGSNMPPPPPPPRRRSNRSSLDQQRPQVSSSSPTESRRTSTEYRRTSTEHRRTSVASESSLRREYAPADEKGGNEYALYSPMEESEKKLGLDENMAGGKEGEGRSDSSNILDDMEKFQREIDELRTKYKQTG